MDYAGLWHALTSGATLVRNLGSIASYLVEAMPSLFPHLATACGRRGRPAEHGRGGAARRDGVCCGPGSALDADGHCCERGRLDVCGMCGGRATVVDITGARLRTNCFVKPPAHRTLSAGRCVGACLVGWARTCK